MNLEGRIVKKKPIDGGTLKGITFPKGILTIETHVSDLIEPGMTMYTLNYWYADNQGRASGGGLGFSSPYFEYLGLDKAMQYYDKISNVNDFMRCSEEFEEWARKEKSK